MNTTTAALQAQVTVITIRTWCRRGVIAATKTAGRWVINSASLARRIAIGAMRTRKATAMTDYTAQAAEARDLVARLTPQRGCAPAWREGAMRDRGSGTCAARTAAREADRVFSFTTKVLDPTTSDDDRAHAHEQLNLFTSGRTRTDAAQGYVYAAERLEYARYLAARIRQP
ncbi:hypothetical protein [Streptomyces sp. NPDC015131]|uniref:hypothetical protein n=1 Tax=Streptomyces sp. NPDC015131 TaxID=3364941 RepID=UPI0036F5E710